VRFWNFIRNQATETQPASVELRIDGDIVDDDEAWLYEWFDEPSASPNAFRNELANYKGEDLTVWIKSYGGSVFAATGIYNALMEHKKNGQKVIVKIDIAMSAATIPAMAGDEVLISPAGIVMIHNPLTGAYGDMRDLRKVADILDTVKDLIINAYMTKTSKSREEISSMMDDETWMSANVAVKNGFANSVLYEDEPLNIENMNHFSFNRLAIINSTNESIKQAIKLFDNPKHDEKDALALELDLI